MTVTLTLPKWLSRLIDLVSLKTTTARRIQLPNAEYAIVDSSDYKSLNIHHWYRTGDCKRDGDGSVVRQANGKHITLKRSLLSVTDPSLFVVCADRNELNLRRSNLLVLNRTQHRIYSRHSDKHAGYRNVSFHKQNSKWKAYINLNKKRVHLGYFNTPEEAARVFNRAAIEHYGPLAQLNDVPAQEFPRLNVTEASEHAR